MKLTSVLLLLILMTSACSRWSRTASVLMITVDSLAMNSFPCTGDFSIKSGFQRFCQDGVRFTHAYTTSPMAVPALSSILTGLYPLDLEVADNGRSFLAAKFVTTAELAANRGWNTAMFSGGPPVFSKSGLGQGFLFQYEEMPAHPDFLYLPVGQLVDIFLTWFDRQSKAHPFFVTLYLPDLQFVDTPTRTELGEVRPNSLQSQLQAVDEGLGRLVLELEKMGFWDRSYVVLVGLNGHDRLTRHNEITALNLFSENSQVTLVIKPPKVSRDVRLNKTIDVNVSLVDLGVTLRDWVQGERSVPSRAQLLPTISLQPFLTTDSVLPTAERMILIESAWSSWHHVGNPRYALRSGQYLFLHQNPPLIFDSYVERTESTPLIGIEAKTELLRFQSVMASLGLSYWTGSPRSYFEKVQVGADLWKTNAIESLDLRSRLKKLAEKRPWDAQVLGWSALLALREQNWLELERLGVVAKDEVWQYVAQVNLNRKVKVPNHPCFGFVHIDESQLDTFYRFCQDNLFNEWVRWLVNRRKKLDNDQQIDEFVRAYSYAEMDRRIAEYNYMNHLAWDVLETQPSGPSLLELAFALPEFSVFKKIIKQRTVNLNQ